MSPQISRQDAEAAKLYRVELVRGVVIDGRTCRAGSVVEVPSVIAGRIVNANKGHLVSEDTPVFEAPAVSFDERVRRLRERNTIAQGRDPASDEPSKARGKSQS
ncbi:MAG: hypothetical protein L0221_10420 [Chloroflexi bacterium]|nr:hypothetical protein [Chloroflexota bacterium]